MQLVLGWILIAVPGLLVLGQLISAINFPLAQRWGLQEKADTADSLTQRAELHTAYWDLLSLIWLPLAGLLMIMDHSWWPFLALLAGGIYFDCGGREAAKMLSFRAEGIRIGSVNEQRLYFGTCVFIGLLGLLAIIYALSVLT